MNIWHPRPPIGVGNDHASSFGAVAVSNSLRPQCLAQCPGAWEAVPPCLWIGWMIEWKEEMNACHWGLKKEWPAKNYQLSPSPKGISYAGHSPDATWSSSCACWADVELRPVVSVSLPRRWWQTRTICGSFEVYNQLASLVMGIWSLPRTVSEVNLFL